MTTESQDHARQVLDAAERIVNQGWGHTLRARYLFGSALGAAVQGRVAADRAKGSSLLGPLALLAYAVLTHDASVLSDLW
jgi:hypothetical protein